MIQAIHYCSAHLLEQSYRGQARLYIYFNDINVEMVPVHATKKIVSVV